MNGERSSLKADLFFPFHSIILCPTIFFFLFFFLQAARISSDVCTIELHGTATGADLFDLAAYVNNVPPRLDCSGPSVYGVGMCLAVSPNVPCRFLELVNTGLGKLGFGFLGVISVAGRSWRPLRGFLYVPSTERVSAGSAGIFPVLSLKLRGGDCLPTCCGTYV